MKRLAGMKTSFKQLDAWGQLILVVVVLATVPFMSSIFLYGYIVIGLWQSISSAIYLIGGTTTERLSRKRYWVGLLVTIIALIICLNTKITGNLYIYLVLFAPSILALWYLQITVQEAGICRFLSKKQ